MAGLREGAWPDRLAALDLPLRIFGISRTADLSQTHAT